MWSARFISKFKDFLNVFTNRAIYEKPIKELHSATVIIYSSASVINFA